MNKILRAIILTLLVVVVFVFSHHLAGTVRGEIIIRSGDIIQGDMSNGLTRDRWIVAESDGTIILGEYPERAEPNTLYEGNPHIYSVYDERHLDEFDKAKIQQLHKDHVGIVNIFSGYYTSGSVPSGRGMFGGTFYDYKPELQDKIRMFIAKAQANGFRVITYNRPYGHEVYKGQSPTKSLLNAIVFSRKYNLDGWYFDGYDFGSYEQTIQMLRFWKQYGQILFVHCSIGLGGGWKTNPWAVRPVFMSRLVDFTYRNEVIPEFQPTSVDDPLWEQMIDRGFGNSISFAKCDHDRIQMPEEEFYKTCGEKGICLPLSDSKWKQWHEWYLPIYLEKRQEAGDE